MLRVHVHRLAPSLDGYVARWGLALFGLLLGACVESASGPVSIGICGPVDPTSGFARRDSSGVRIVENLAPAADGTTIPIGDDPMAVVGARETDSDDVIGQLASAVLLSDGRIVIADGSSLEIRVHTPDGTFVRRFGGDGSGPGEFSRNIDLFRGAGDTLVVAHDFGVRYARLLADGSYVDGGQIPDRRRLMAVFGDGDFLVADRNVLAGGPEPVTEVIRLELMMRRLDRMTGQLDSVGVVPGDDYFNFVQTGELAGAITFGALPGGRVESRAVGDVHFFLGRGDHFEVERRSEGGALTELIRVCEPVESLAPGVVQRAIDERLAPLEGRGREYELRALEGIPHPTTEPAHLEMLAGVGGQLWVRAFGPDWEEREWRVFSDEGRWLRSVTLPARSRLLDIGEDRLLVALTNDLGVERVESHAVSASEVSGSNG